MKNKNREDSKRGNLRAYMLMNGDWLLRQEAPNWWWKTRKSWLMGRLRLDVTFGSRSNISQIIEHGQPVKLKKTHSVNSICIYIHFAHQSQNKKQNKIQNKSISAMLVWDGTPKSTQQNKNRAKHIDTKNTRRDFSSARVPRAAGQIWWTGRPRSLHRWALSPFPHRTIANANIPAGTNYMRLHSCHVFN